MQNSETLPSPPISLYTFKYFGTCSLGGLLSCGLTHTLITPLDLVKCRKQVNPQLYPSLFSAFRSISRQRGFSGVWEGWVPTAFGYSLQGACKFGFYEFFKKYYADLVGEERAFRYRTALYLGASATAEAIADVALCPLETIKVKLQTSATPFASSTATAFQRILAEGGAGTLYKGLVPLWLRQVPYTMMKFAAFERTVEAIYRHILPNPKSHYNKTQQLGVTFAAGYWAGIFCAVVSHPADTLVSKLNHAERGTAFSALVRELGFRGLWRGLGTRIFMIGTLTALQWFIYDTFKVYAGLPTSGATAKADVEGKC